MMRSGIHVFLTAPPCDVWQLSGMLSPGGGQRAKHGRAILSESFLPRPLQPCIGVRKKQWEEWVEGWGSLCAERGEKKKGHDGHQVTDCRCARVRDDEGNTGNSIRGCDNQRQILVDRVKCCTCPDYSAMKKWSAPVQSISVPSGTDKNANLIVTHGLLANHVSSGSLKWVPGLRISPDGAGYCTRIIIKLCVTSHSILLQPWIEKRTQLFWHAKIGYWSVR